MLHRAYPICEALLSRSARRSSAPLQKSRRNHRFYVNRNPIRYGFRAGARTIRCSVNTALVPLVSHVKSRLVFFCLYETSPLLQHKLNSYRHKLDSVGPVHQSQQQIRLDIHICMIRRCYYKHDWLHKHLGTGIHLNLRRLQGKFHMKWKEPFIFCLSKRKGHVASKTAHVLKLRIK